MTVLIAALLCQQVAVPVTAAVDEFYRIRTVTIRTGDVYSEDELPGRPFYEAVNALHATTRVEVVQREMWFGEGDLVSPDQAQELERNLRATGLFAVVQVELVETGQEGVRDLVVDTRDRLSLVFGAAGSVVGGVGGVEGFVGENNLFGYGDTARLDFRRNDEGEERYGISFFDRHFIDGLHQLDGNVGETEEGSFYGLGIRRRFRHLEDSWGWSLRGFHSEDATDFFEAGESVAEVPREARGLQGSLEHAFGHRNARRLVGLQVRYDDTDYEAAVGPNAGEIDVPGDTSTLTAGVFGRVDWITGREKVTNFDTLDFVQDVELGVRPELFLGAVSYDEEGEERRWEPLVGASLRSAVKLGPETYGTLGMGGFVRSYAGRAQGWNASTSLHGYHILSPSQTLAGSLTYDGVFEREGLEAQLTLGEDNGLRGYPARQFTGTRRVRLNLEDRIDTGFELRSIHVDAVVFADAGWIEGEDVSPDDVLTSAGVGLRIGSRELFGDAVLRVDFAFPLNDVDGLDRGVSVSVDLGQVFSFFGNPSSLPGR